MVSIALVVLLWPAAAAHAQRHERTAVALVVAADAPQDWGWEVRAALRRTRRVDPRAVDPAEPVRDGEAASAAEQLLTATAEAERAFRQADFESCVQRATADERRLAPVLAESRALRSLGALVALAAACELKRGATAVALERANLALALDPALTLDPTRHPPDVAELFENARRTRTAAPSIAVDLSANVPDARFEIDGREVPAHVQIDAGTHWVLARAAGARTAIRPITVVEPGGVALDLQPADAEAARAELATPPRSADLGAGTGRAAAIATGARLACGVTQARPGHVTIMLWQVVGLQVSELGRADAPPPRDAAGWSSLLGSVHSLLRPRPRRGADRSAGAGLPAWVWVAGAAALVAAGTAVTIALWPEEPEDRIRLEPGGSCIGGPCCEWPDC